MVRTGRFSVSNAPSVGDYLQLMVTKTNGTQMTITVTNTAPGTNTSGLTAQLINAINGNSRCRRLTGWWPGISFPTTLTVCRTPSSTCTREPPGGRLRRFWRPSAVRPT